MRFRSGANGTVVFVLTKILKVGVAPWATFVTTDGVGGARHAPVLGLVSHTAKLIAGLVKLACGVTSITSVAPTFAVATAKAPGACGPASTTPELVAVPANAITSATTVLEADSNTVLSPDMICAGLVLLPLIHI